MDWILSVLVRAIAAFAQLRIGSCKAWKPGERLRVLLVGYNGARNTGSDVRVAALTRQLKDIFGPDNVHITVMTLDRAELAGYFDEDVTLRQFSSIFLWDLYRACSESHAAILCEGSTLKSTFANGLTLFMCEAAGIMAAQGKPCIAYGSEVGHMDPYIRRTARRLCRDTYFITRTEDALTALKALGLAGRAGTDTAWTYDGAIGADEARAMLTRQGWDGRKPLLGVAVIDPFCWPVRASLGKWFRAGVTGRREGQYDKWYFFSDSPRRRADCARYIDGVAQGVGDFLREHDCFPVVIGMERLDERPCADLAARLDRPCAMFLSGSTPANVMAGILHRLDVLVTSRYHAAVLGMQAGVPFVAVSMDERLDGIAKELGVADNCLCHVTDTELDSIATFYRQFKDKYDLIAWDYARDVQKLLEQEDGTQKDWRQSLSEAADYYDEQREYLANLLTNTRGYDSFIRYMTEIHFNALMNRIRAASDPDGPDRKTEMLVRLYGFSTVMLTCEWILGKYPVSRETLTEVYAASLPEPLHIYFQ